MRRTLAWLLLIAMILSLAGCAVESAPAATVVETSQTTAEESTGAELEETQPNQEENLFLKVSSITFSLVGEREDIYLGLIPRKQVTWTSEDPSVVDVEDGVLTAVGVGTTTIHASYHDRQVSCTAACLAQTQEELEALDAEILSAPKWVIPEVNMDEPCTYFDNAAIVGDSVTFGLMQHESQSNGLGNILFLARGGVSVIGFVKRVKNITFRGREMNLEDAIAQSGVARVYFLMGANDVAGTYTMESMLEYWKSMLDRIWEKSPDVQIVLMSIIPRYNPSPKESTVEGQYNQEVLEYNTHLRQFAEEQGCMFLDLHGYIQDHWGRTSLQYKLPVDNTHLNELGCTNWMKIMRYYAQYESEGGTLE